MHGGKMENANDLLKDMLENWILWKSVNISKIKKLQNQEIDENLRKQTIELIKTHTTCMVYLQDALFFAELIRVLKLKECGKELLLLMADPRKDVKEAAEEAAKELDYDSIKKLFEALPKNEQKDTLKMVKKTINEIQPREVEVNEMRMITLAGELGLITCTNKLVDIFILGGGDKTTKEALEKMAAYINKHPEEKRVEEILKKISKQIEVCLKVPLDPLDKVDPLNPLEVIDIFRIGERCKKTVVFLANHPRGGGKKQVKKIIKDLGYDSIKKLYDSLSKDEKKEVWKNIRNIDYFIPSANDELIRAANLISSVKEVELLPELILIASISWEYFVNDRKLPYVTRNWEKITKTGKEKLEEMIKAIKNGELVVPKTIQERIRKLSNSRYKRIAENAKRVLKVINPGQNSTLGNIDGAFGKKKNTATGGRELISQ